MEMADKAPKVVPALTDQYEMADLLLFIEAAYSRKYRLLILI